MSFVSLVRIAGSDFQRAITKSLDLINYEFDDAVARVVIKPNMCYYWDKSTGQTTDPAFIGALIEIIRKKTSNNVDIAIVESDASAMKCRYAFRLLGYEKLAKDYGVRLVNLSEDKKKKAIVTVGEKIYSLLLPQTIAEADLKINVPKIKYMDRSGIKITCALKNLYGCIPYAKKFRYHPFLPEVIVAINKVMPFDLSIVDGNVVSGISPIKLKLVMASKDPVAIDVAAAKIAGENPRLIPYFSLAYREGIGNKSCIPVGESIEYFKERYPRRTLRRKLMGIAYKAIVRTKLSNKIGLN
ncbi:DUF362 domain-containing protein [Candidatus Bathyarchaeota archaeon]|nr:DUF362 domain-containing protein [Candidatus Bathyarchaeota archaeon]